MNQHPGFNPRAQQNSNALSGFVVADLCAASPSIQIGLASGLLHEKKNAEVYTKVANRNVDLILHTGTAPVISVVTSVENKSIMAAHGKARKNRYGDLIAYSNHMHNHRRDCIAAGIVIVNISPTYENPDPFAKGMVRAKFDMQKVVAATVKLFAGMPLRDDPDEPSDQPEALAVIVVDYDGGNPSKLVTELPAPQLGESIHYGSFLKRIAILYEKRFNQPAQ
ncbi:hypothetical protein [Candidatus Binatus soli]|jgi:hypothetical protein|uniref:hypothetical protein n=1 Tax=Candidatus Binatus soli TaxID=1953413 RepID=UPI003D1245CD